MQQLRLHDGSLAFRLGPVFGPYLVAREVARECGPQIAVAGSRGEPCLVSSTTTYEEFHEAVLGCPPPADGSDREWSQPPSEEWKHAHAAPEEWPDSPQGWLDFALSGRRGHAMAAGEVGGILRLFHAGEGGAVHGRGHMDQTRYAALVARLREYIRATRVPDAGLVLALGAAPEARADLEALAQRLEGIEGAEEALRMALLGARRHLQE